jgi:hypothetical protein
MPDIVKQEFDSSFGAIEDGFESFLEHMKRKDYIIVYEYIFHNLYSSKKVGIDCTSGGQAPKLSIRDEN